MSWYAQSGPRSKDLGKFRSRSLANAEKSTDGQHRGWRYTLVARQTGTSVRRTCYSVSILDTNGNQAAHLRDFSSAAQAISGAHDWIDNTLSLSLTTARPGEVGTIPALPSQNASLGSAATQEK